MRILHLITRLDFGGSSENVLLCAQGSARAGQRVLIAAGPSSAVDFQVLRQEGFSVLYLAVPDLIRAVHPWRDLKAFFQILRLLRDWKPEIVHTHSSKAGILGRWAAWVYRRLLLASGSQPPRIVHTPHGHVFYGYFGLVKSGFYLWVERVTAHITDDLVALSEGEKRESLERGVGRPEQWTVIHSGVTGFSSTGQGFSVPPLPLSREEVSEGDTFWRVRIPSDAVVIGCIARLEPVKGVRVLVEAASLVRSSPEGKSAIFWIIGDGEQRSDLENRVRAAGNEENILFAGYQKEPGAFLSLMDIYVQPSLNEGMGKTVVMAQAAGLPVVASRVCGIPDIVVDGETGLLVPPSDPKALACAILRLAGDESLRESMGQAAKRRMSGPDETGHPRFSAESMVARLETLYSRACS